MNQLERLYRIRDMLQARGKVPIVSFLNELEISRATFKRDLEVLRDRFHAPIVYNAFERAYEFERLHRVGPRFELPGLWFSQQEALALITMHSMLLQLDQAGFIGPHLSALIERVEATLGGSQTPGLELRKRLRLISHAQRSPQLSAFQQIGKALLERKQLLIRYASRSKNEVSERMISPQRLTHYRENWYLDAWCHMRRGLRSFSLDLIMQCQPTTKTCKEVSNRTLDAHTNAGYGIFAGRVIGTARLRFSPERARWVQSEQWHPKQRLASDAEGYVLMELPFSLATLESAKAQYA
ncbi:MAG: WYL domain-containing protein [Betaproteobacteria bacterium]|nr:WYL domain-containing protein [Betaproteobacteria bacterium]